MDEKMDGIGVLEFLKAKMEKVLTRPKVFIAGLVLGGILVSIMFTVIFNIGKDAGAKETSPETLSPTVVFERIVSQNEMVTVSQNYAIVDKSTDDKKLFDLIEIPFTRNSFWYRYAGTIKAGVNLENAEITLKGNTITITMDKPYVISNTPDMQKSGVLEENNNVFNPIKVEDVTAFERQCKERSESEAIKDGKLLEEAQANAEANIRAMFNSAFGDQYKVEFVYRQ